MGNTIKVKVTFRDYHGFEETLESAATATVVEASAAIVLVKNTGQSDDGMISIEATKTKLAQAFETGANPAGYTVGSIGISFNNITNTSTAGSQLVATLNKESSGNPGDVVCTLDDPASFSASGVHTFAPPSGGCPALAADETYFVVLERVNPTVQGIKLDTTTSKTEDTEGESDWSIANSRHYIFSGSWTSLNANVLMIEVEGFVNTAPTGAPSIQGVLQTGETLTADTVGIGDPDGLTTPNYAYQWIKVASDDTETDIPGATGSTYTLTSDEEEHGIKVRVSFTDDLGTTETLTSAQTGDVVPENATRRLLWLATMEVEETGNNFGFLGTSNKGKLAPGELRLQLH